MNEKYLNLLSFVDKSVEEMNLICNRKKQLKARFHCKGVVKYSSAVSKGINDES